MNAFEAVRTVVAIRRYQAKPLPAEVVQQIVEAGRLTGSSMNMQPWHFLVVQNPETLRRLGALARTGPYIAEAPLAVVVLTERTEYAVSDASRAIQSMMLAGWAAGVGSNWVGFFGLDALRELLGVPAALDVFAVIPFGYPVDEVGQGKKKRKPQDETVSSERFGQLFAG